MMTHTLDKRSKSRCVIAFRVTIEAEQTKALELDRPADGGMLPCMRTCMPQVYSTMMIDDSCTI